MQLPGHLGIAIVSMSEVSGSAGQSQKLVTPAPVSQLGSAWMMLLVSQALPPAQATVVG